MKKTPSSESFYCNTGQEQMKSGNQQLNFIQKAYQLVNNPDNSQIIHWNRSGHTFIIENIDRFERELLPLYFRHNRYQSFVRQLNMYDFHKIRNGDYYCENKSQFRHEEFTRGNFQQILKIRRKGFQAKNKQKQNTKIKKGYKINVKKNIRRKKIKITPERKVLQPFIQEQPNSFFHQMPVNQQQINLLFYDRLQDVSRKIEHVISDIVQNFKKDNIFLLQKKNKISQIIDLAQRIKEKWLEATQKSYEAEDIKIMKDIYYRIKEKLNQQFQIQDQMRKLQNLNAQQKQKSHQFQFLHTISEQQAIIDSIFRTQIRSTLICINSETILNNGYPCRKIDTLIGM